MSGSDWLRGLMAILVCLLTAAVPAVGQEAGTVLTCGSNSAGELGDGTTTQRSVLQPVLGPGGTGLLTNIVAISPNGQFAVRSDGSVWAWGSNVSGALGDGTITNRPTPVQVVGQGGLGFLDNIVSVDNSMALRGDGTLWTWGGNASRRGDGTTDSYRTTPLQVKQGNATTPLTRVKAAALGGNNGVALRLDGTVWCWGSGIFGNLGDGTTSAKLYAVQVKGPGGVGYLTDVVAVGYGSDFGLALKSDGTLWSWGCNLQCQLGDGTRINRSTPVPVVGPGGTGTMTNVKAFDIGATQTYVLRNDGTVWTWGYDTLLQAFDPPHQIPGPEGVGYLTDVEALACSAGHLLIRRTDGSVYAWGSNGYGQLGVGHSLAVGFPVQVLGAGGTGTLQNAAGLGTGASYSTVLVGPQNPPTLTVSLSAPEGGTLQVEPAGPYTYGQHVRIEVSVADGWYFAGWSGDVSKLMDPQSAVTNLLVRGATELTAVVERIDGNTITAGVETEGTGSILLLPEKPLYTLGETVTAQAVAAEGYAFVEWLAIPDGATTASDKLTFVVSGHTTLTARFQPLTPKRMWAWGSNTYGQLGDGTTLYRPLPISPLNADLSTPVEDVVAVSAGSTGSYLLKSDGSLWRLISSGATQLKAGGISAISSGRELLCIKNDRRLSISFATGLGQIAANSLEGVVAVSAGENHSMAVCNDGTVWTWGDNGYGQLGSGDTLSPSAPVHVVGPEGGEEFLSGVKVVAAGTYHSLALKSDGTVWTWGARTGQASVSRPVQVPGPEGVGFLTDIVAIDAGANFSMALRSDGTVWAWGNNASGQLGDGTTISRSTPVQVRGIGGTGYLADVVAISAGLSSAGAVLSSGQVVTLGTTPALVAGPLGTTWLSGVCELDIGGSHYLAVCAPALRHTLTAVASPVAGGTVAMAPQQSDYATGESVVLSATPATGYVFAGWSGDTSALGNPAAAETCCAMLRDVSVEAVFVPFDSIPIVATAVPAGGGTITFEPQKDAYTLGETVTLQAVASADYAFIEWKGLPDGALVNGTQVSFAVPGAVQIEACFGPRLPAGQVCRWPSTDGLFPAVVMTADGPLADITSVAASSNCMALKSDGTVWTWSTGPATAVPGPSGEGLLTDVAAVACGSWHYLALKSDGTVWGWGNNTYYQLGDGTTLTRQWPVQVKGSGGTGVLTGVLAIVANGNTSMALKADGTVWVWGMGQYQYPTQVVIDKVGPLTGIKAISRSAAVDEQGRVWTFEQGTFAVQQPTMTGMAEAFEFLTRHGDGTVWTWGYNFYGQLGDGTTISRMTPGRVLSISGSGPLTGISAIARGTSTETNYAIDPVGSVVAWGYGRNGQLGNGTLEDSLLPVRVKGVNGVGWLNNMEVVAGGHALGLAVAGPVRRHHLTVSAAEPEMGTVQCLQPGPDYVYGTGVVLEPQGNVGWKSVGWSGDTDALYQAGPTRWYCLMTRDIELTAIFTNQLELTTSVDQPEAGSIVLTPQKQFYAYGETVTAEIQTNIGWLFSRWSQFPPQVYTTADHVTFVMDREGTLRAAFTPMAPGAVAAAGYNFYGQIGDGTSAARYIPVQVKGAGGVGLLADVVDTAAGVNTSFALKADGTVWAWGQNHVGQLGDGTTIGRLTPVQVSNAEGTGGLTDVVSVRAGILYSLALRQDGTVWSWGRNDYGRLGDGTTTNRTRPVPVLGPLGQGQLTEIMAVATGLEHAVALRSDGTVWTWGHNHRGQLGNNTTTDSLTPVQVKGPGGEGFLTGIVAIAAGGYHNVAVKLDGTVWSWGWNDVGELGDNTRTQRNTPVQVKGPGLVDWLTGAVDVRCGTQHNIVLLGDGSVMCWGLGTSGQLGNNATVTSRRPVQVLTSDGSPVSGATLIAAGAAHGMAVDGQGVIWTWGLNADGQLADGMTETHPAAVPVRSIYAGTESISGGTNHSLMVPGPVAAHTVAVTANDAERGDIYTTWPQDRVPARRLVIMVATPRPGWIFDGWSGDTSALFDPRRSPAASRRPT